MGGIEGGVSIDVVLFRITGGGGRGFGAAEEAVEKANKKIPPLFTMVNVDNHHQLCEKAQRSSKNGPDVPGKDVARGAAVDTADSLGVEDTGSVTIGLGVLGVKEGGVPFGTQGQPTDKKHGGRCLVQKSDAGVGHAGKYGKHETNPVSGLELDRC